MIARYLNSQPLEFPFQKILKLSTDIFLISGVSYYLSFFNRFLKDQTYFFIFLAIFWFLIAISHFAVLPILQKSIPWKNFSRKRKSYFI